MHKFLALLAALTVAVSAQARDLTNEEKLSDLNQMVSRLKSGYGPLQYKKSKLGIDVDLLQAKYAAEIANTKSNGEFYYKIMNFIAEFKDGHFSANLPTTHKASLPFTVDLVQGKVLIDEINREKLPVDKFVYQRGDEVVEFNGQPIGDVVQGLMAYIPNGYELSVRRLATMSLTVRSGTRMPVPQDKNVTMKIRRGESSIIETVSLEWTYEGEPLDESPKPASFGPLRQNYVDLSTFAEMANYKNPQVERSFRCSGNTRIEIPKDATVIMTKPFVAYYHPTAKGNVGYLRMPHFSPAMDDSEPKNPDVTELRLAKYEYAVQVLEANTVALVVDEQHNCGGSVAYLHQFSALLMDKPFEPIKFEMLASKEEYLYFKAYASDRYKDTIEQAGLQKLIDLIKTSWEQGLNMTPKISLDARDLVYPNTIHYTKPIVVLIDEVSGSGGDAFPALMQGTGRARLIGERTMGLGGHVVEQPPLGYSRIAPRITKSLFYHPNGTAIENNGASPDVAYQPTRNDFMYGYKEFQQFYTAELLKEVK
jgi:C-terminal processing protease CtpA/Prc